MSSEFIFRVSARMPVQNPPTCGFLSISDEMSRVAWSEVSGHIMF